MVSWYTEVNKDLIPMYCIWQEKAWIGVNSPVSLGKHVGIPHPTCVKPSFDKQGNWKTNLKAGLLGHEKHAAEDWTSGMMLKDECECGGTLLIKQR